MRKSKRAILKSKVYGFNPWADQVPAINQIMEETGQRSEAPVVRDLVDEALAARRRNGGPPQVFEQPANGEAATEALNSLQTLLLRMIAEEETVGRIQGVTLELIQEGLAEARLGRKLTWSNLVIPALREKGMSAEEIERRFDAATEESRSYAYALAEEVRQTQDLPSEADDLIPAQALLF